MQVANMHWDYIAILVLLAIVIPWRSTTRVQSLLESAEFGSTRRMALYLSTMVFQWALAGIILWRSAVRGLSEAQLGLDIPNVQRAITVTIVLSVVLVLNQIFGIKRLARVPLGERGMIGRLAEKLLPRSRREAFVGIGLVVTVAICEEFIYRGFVEGIFQQSLRSVIAGAVISALFFAVAHLYQGRRGLLTTFAVGLIFSAARVWTGSLLPSIIVHFVADFSAGVAASRMLLGDAGTSSSAAGERTES
jgi:membrane protease YdiL (CAAX protease family)